MLSDETANGQYPIRQVRVMKRVTTYAERNNPLTVTFPVSLIIVARVRYVTPLSIWLPLAS